MWWKLHLSHGQKCHKLLLEDTRRFFGELPLQILQSIEKRHCNKILTQGMKNYETIIIGGGC